MFRTPRYLEKTDYIQFNLEHRSLFRATVSTNEKVVRSSL
jgi:hypothetical protein